MLALIALAWWLLGCFGFLVGFKLPRRIVGAVPVEKAQRNAEQQRYRQWWPASTMVAVIPVEPSDLDARVPMYSVTTDKNGVKVRYVKRKGVDVSGPIVGKSITQSFIDDVVSHG